MGEDSKSWAMSLRSGTSRTSYDYAMSIYASEFAVPVNSTKHIAKFIFAPDLYLKRGRITQILYFSVIVATAALIVYVQLGMMANQDATQRGIVDKVAVEIERLATAEILMQLISRERNALIKYLLADGGSVAKMEQDWQSAHEGSFQIVNQLSLWPVHDDPEFADYTKNSRLYTVEIEAHRSNVKRIVNATSAEMTYYTGVMEQFLNSFAFSMRDLDIGEFWPEAASFFFLSEARFEVDRLRTIVTAGAWRNRPETLGAERVVKEATQVTEISPVLAAKYLEMAMVYANTWKPLEAISSRDCQLCRIQRRVFEYSEGLVPENFENVNKSYFEWEAKISPILQSFTEDLAAHSRDSLNQQELVVVDIVITVIATTTCCFVAYAIVKLSLVFTEIRDRTDQLRGKTEEADNLLYQMLPVAVAKMLKEGGQIAPEFFEEATVYFNDVYGFNEFVSSTEPSKIVALLNNLYRSLDERIELYGCYKVETVSDTYMVVGGVPKRRSDHAAAIALMALDMIETAKQIPMGDGYVRIRIGMNTGPVFAGVVGLVMPRYCLFGDTVNTASRMESTSKPLHAHCSEKTCIALRKYGGFNLEYRGKVPVKGKGEMKTYWLRSAETTTVMTASFGLNKEAPTPEALDEGVSVMTR